MKRATLLAASVVLIAMPIAARAQTDEGWIKFSAHHALSHVDIDVSIGTQITGGQEIYWIRRTTQKLGRQTGASQIDSRSCPRILPALRSLSDLPMPQPKLPFPSDAPIIVTADGIGYSLTVPVAYPGEFLTHDVTLTSNVGTPLAAWIDDALAIVDSCMPK